jgi:hypothetical protein
MSHWTINDGELRRQVQAQGERYRELRRRSDEARLLDEVCGPRTSLLEQARRWFAVATRRAQPLLPSAPELEQGRG